MTESVALRPNISFSSKYDNDVNIKLKRTKKFVEILKIEELKIEDC